MNIGIFHGYELTGSGCNADTRRLAEALIRNGHEVHLLCREPDPANFHFMDQALAWSAYGEPNLLFKRATAWPGKGVLHQLPVPTYHPACCPVDEIQRQEKTFIQLTNSELCEYHYFVSQSVQNVLQQLQLDVFHTNHLIYEPVASIEACAVTETPLIIFPQGCTIESILQKDQRYLELALKAMFIATGLIIKSVDLRERLFRLYPSNRNEILEKTITIDDPMDLDENEGWTMLATQIVNAYQRIIERKK